MYRYLLIAGLLLSLKTFSQTIDITSQWKMNVGDSSFWSSLSYDDDHWKTAEKIGPFERKGLGNFQNFGWVRKKVVVPSSMKEAAQRAGYFYLSLGKIYDAEQVYYNGKLIGHTGGMPPGEKVVERGARIYKVNAKEIFWDKENLIAVRIFANFHNGGLQGENCYIVIPSETIFHATAKTVPAYPLSQGRQAFEAAINADHSSKNDALKGGGVSLNINLPGNASVFYNGKLLGITNLLGEQVFFVPLSLISWNTSDKLIVYLDSSDALSHILFAGPRLSVIEGDHFHLLQIGDLKVKKGSLYGSSPVTVSVKVLNNTGVDFAGKLTVTLTTDANKVQQSSSHFIHLNKLQDKEIDFTLSPDFSGVYQVNYIFEDEKGDKLKGTLAKGVRP
jgi:hypothetical protein